MTDVPAFTSRCPFCSLLCPIAVERRGHELFVPGYVSESQGVRQGVCARGQLVCDLAAHARRLNEAWMGNGSVQTAVNPEAALADAASRLQQFEPNEVAVVAAGANCRGIVAGHAFVQAAFSGGTFAAFLPAEDEACLDGLSASGAALASQEDVSQADALLIVGDPFASRPVLARAVHAAKIAAQRMPLVVVDSVPGITGQFASLNVVMRPGSEAHWLAALLKRLAPDEAKLNVERSALDKLSEGLGDEVVQADAAAEALGKAKRLVVVVAPEFGRSSSWDAIALLAGQMARANGGKVFAALSAANALGAYRMARHLGGARMAELYERIDTGQTKALVCVGVDMAAAWPRLEPALRSMALVIAAAPMPSGTSELAYITLPLALAFEEPFVALEADAARVDVSAGLPAPRGALSAEELFRSLAGQLGKPLSEPDVEDSLLAQPEPIPAERIVSACAQPIAAETGQLVLVGESNAFHAGDGSLSRWTRWSAATAPEPPIRLNPRDAQALEAREGASLVCEESSLQVVVSDDVPAGVAVVSSHFAQARKLFDCHVDRERGRLTIGPTAVPVTAFSA